MHIQVGRSIILNTQSRLRRIVVSNPNVLDTTTVSATQVVVTAKAAGSSSLVLWDESSNAHIVDVYADVDVSGLRDGVSSAYPGEAVQIEAEQGRVLVSRKVDSKAVADDVLRMAGIYSKDIVNSLMIVPSHEKQIMLKVQFAEVDRIKLEQFGINILSTGAANTARNDFYRAVRAIYAGQCGIDHRCNWRSATGLYDQPFGFKLVEHFLVPSGPEPGRNDSGSSAEEYSADSGRAESDGAQWRIC